MKNPEPRILLAIPVYNEESYVSKVLNQVKKYAPSDILVIDDGSTDGTPLLLAQNKVEVIRHAENRGYGRSMIDAFRWACCYKFDWVITIDCDEQHEPESIPAFIEAIKNHDADIISGSRYLNHHAEDIGLPPADRRKINKTITHLVNEILETKITDAFCGFKAYRTKAVNSLDLTETGYAFPLQFWVQAKAKGLITKELPIRLIYNDPNRTFGGPLDNQESRLKHYLSIFDTELQKHTDQFGHLCTKCALDEHNKPIALNTQHA